MWALQGKAQYVTDQIRSANAGPSLAFFVLVAARLGRRTKLASRKADDVENLSTSLLCQLGHVYRITIIRKRGTLMAIICTAPPPKITINLSLSLAPVSIQPTKWFSLDSSLRVRLDAPLPLFHV